MIGALLAEQAIEVTSVEAARAGQAVLLFVLLAIVLGAMFVLALVITRARRLRRNQGPVVENNPVPAPDPWKEAGQRVKSPGQKDQRDS